MVFILYSSVYWRLRLGGFELVETVAKEWHFEGLGWFWGLAGLRCWRTVNWLWLDSDCRFCGVLKVLRVSKMDYLGYFKGSRGWFCIILGVV